MNEKNIIFVKNYMKKILFCLLIFSNSLFSQNTKVIGDSIFSLVKQERIKNKSQSEIFFSDRLCKVAEVQAKYILTSGNVSHRNPNVGYETLDDRVKKFGFRGPALENITYFPYNEQKEDSLAKTAVNNFMNSPLHRYALLSGGMVSKVPTAYGQSIIYDFFRKKILVVQIFLECFYSSDY